MINLPNPWHSIGHTKEIRFKPSLSRTFSSRIDKLGVVVSCPFFFTHFPCSTWLVACGEGRIEVDIPLSHTQARQGGVGRRYPGFSVRIYSSRLSYTPPPPTFTSQQGFMISVFLLLCGLPTRWSPIYPSFVWCGPSELDLSVGYHRPSSILLIGSEILLQWKDRLYQTTNQSKDLLVLVF